MEKLPGEEISRVLRFSSSSSFDFDSRSRRGFFRGRCEL